ncbi:Hsp20/alpha crystallin family protein [Lacisediminihabitans profunda]|uniref:Hsp20/alpha crystallin family protein n=1 Tax=Lacisediminihabitans profunda TaxID=2594790 RepID=A0A5C8URR0_9MICO|nr:Hsp20/alpha crystallin family protein [Lacisediminihabitans profunda]TXN31254.1 Hsp20/alpha crystallin family protein [Lacisediminihabitans profunda]
MARNLVRFDPFAELNALQKEYFGDGFLPARGSKYPTTDVYTEDDKQLTVEAHLPNFAEKDISVDVDQGALVIQAEKHEKEEDKKKKYVVRESSSSFYRRITLPEQADDSHISAQFADGVLKVVVPFKELPAPKKIAITTGGATS